MADEGLRKTDQTLGQAAAVHQFAGKNEQRNRQQRKTVGRIGRALRENHDRYIGDEEHAQCRQANRERNRYAYGEQPEKQAKHGDRNHGRVNP